MLDSLYGFLRAAVDDLEALIEINRLDINDIKEANHDAIFARLEAKNNLVASFEEHKSLADSEMIRLSKHFPNKTIGEILDDESMNLIDSMRENLKTLRTLNKNYAKSVVAVYEFYNSMLDSMFPSQKFGYSSKSFESRDLVHIEA